MSWHPHDGEIPELWRDRLIAWAAPRLQQVGDEAAFKDAQRDLGVASKGAFQARYRDTGLDLGTRTRAVPLPAPARTHPGTKRETWRRLGAHIRPADAAGPGP
jgi:hypothetical protein